jgi:hypothetical protein
LTYSTKKLLQNAENKTLEAAGSDPYKTRGQEFATVVQIADETGFTPIYPAAFPAIKIGLN